MSIFKKQTNIKILTPQEKMQQAQGIVNSAFSVFKKLISDIDNANKILDEASKEAENEIASLEAKLRNTKGQLASIDSERLANIGLKQKWEQMVK